jgi:hypothetical protein
MGSKYAREKEIIQAEKREKKKDYIKREMDI